MFNGSRFFNLAKKWTEEEKDPSILHILQHVMNHYFSCIVGTANKEKLIINGYYTVDKVSFVLDAVGYHNYSMQYTEDAKIIIVLRNTL